MVGSCGRVDRGRGAWYRWSGGASREAARAARAASRSGSVASRSGSVASRSGSVASRSACGCPGRLGWETRVGRLVRLVDRDEAPMLPGGRAASLASRVASLASRAASLASRAAYLAGRSAWLRAPAAAWRGPGSARLGDARGRLVRTRRSRRCCHAAGRARCQGRHLWRARRHLWRAGRHLWRAGRLGCALQQRPVVAHWRHGWVRAWVGSCGQSTELIELWREHRHPSPPLPGTGEVGVSACFPPARIKP